MSSDSLKKLTRDMPADGGEEILHDMGHTESDRGAATLACSVVEYALRRFLGKHMIELSAAEEGSLFFNSGPLSDFGGLISISYAFGLIDQKMKEDLLLLKDIRNTFGHAPQRISFETDAIKARCERFHTLKVLKEKEPNPRKQYLSAAKTMFIMLKFTAAGKTLPLPFGLSNLPSLAKPPQPPKTGPSSEMSPEQFLQALASLHPADKNSEPSPQS